MSSKFEGIIENLKNKNSTGISKIYSQLISTIKKNRKGDIKLLSDIVTCVRRDLVSKDVETADAAFKFLSHFCSIAVNQLCNDDENSMTAMLIEALMSTATVDCIHEYFPVLFSHIPKDDLVTLSYQTVCQEKKSLPVVVKEEMLKLLSNMSVDRENATPNFTNCYPQMLQIALVFTVDDNDLVRKEAVRTAADFIQACPLQPTEISQIIACLKNLICPNINLLLKKHTKSLHEVLDGQLPLYLKIIGINMRKSSSLTNTLLKIIEQGFRHSAVEIRSASFKTWRVLIDELSVDLELLSSQRYLNLVLQPLTTTQASESLNLLRIEILWGLARKLKNKLPALFSSVCLPILHCCLGNLDTSQRPVDVSAASIKASRNSNFYAAMQATGYRATPKKASNSSQLHKIGVEVLLRLLAYSDKEDLVESDKFTIPKLDDTFLATPVTFNFYGLIFIAAVEEVLCNKHDISSDLAIMLWDRIHHHLKALLELNLQKKKREPEMFNALILAFKNILMTSSLSSEVTFAMLKSFLAFPDAILSSTFYGGASNGVHGFPALTLLQLLFSGGLIFELSSNDSHELLTCACKLVTLGFDSMIGVLPYCSSVLDILLSFAQKSLVGNADESSTIDRCVDVMFQMWVKIGAGLKEHVEKTQEVNQGDNLDHDFTTLYYFLLFPAHAKTFKNDYINIWDSVYGEFFKGSSFVPTCKPNEICSYISSRILKLVDDSWSNSILEFAAHVCNTMARKAQYNHGGFSKPKASRRDSTGASPKRQNASLMVLEIHENLADLCGLVKKLFEIMNESPLPHILDSNMKCLAHLFSSIYYSEDIKILFRTFLPSLKSLVSKDHDDMKMFCEQLRTIFHAVENVYRSCVVENNMEVFQEDFHLLVCECVKSASSKIRNIAVELWQNVVVNSKQHTAICESMTGEMKSRLFPVYKVMGWSCPWKDVELPATLEMPEYTEDTQSSDMVTVGYGAYGSPCKSNRLSSPRKTPLRVVSYPLKAVGTTPKRKLDTTIDTVKYVNCVSPFTKPRTPLTERQKEKLREREFIPTMYNELDERPDMEIITQDDLDVDNSQENAASAGDIIESSQSQESPKKKMKIHILKSSQSLESPKKKLKMDTGEKDRRNSTATTRVGDKLINSQSQKCDTAKEAQQLHDVSEVSGSEHTSKDDQAMSPAIETAENIDDQELDADSTFDSSHQYVEMKDVSTNETFNDGSIVLSDDEKDLGVMPFDESYEYVAVADMSVSTGTGNLRNTSLLQTSMDSRDVSVDIENIVKEFGSKRMDAVSVKLKRIADVHIIKSSSKASSEKKKSQKGKKKEQRQANIDIDDSAKSFHDNSTADCRNSDSSTLSQSSAKGEQNLKMAAKASKEQVNRKDTEFDDDAADQPLLRRSKRSKKKSSKMRQAEKDAEVVQDSASCENVKSHEVCIDDEINDERPTSMMEISPVSSPHSEFSNTPSKSIEKYSDVDVTGAGSDDERDANDSSLYEYVEVADTSCCNATRQSFSCLSHASSTFKISQDGNIESESVVETDASMTASDADIICDADPASKSPVHSANSTFVVKPDAPGDIVSASIKSTSISNSTFVIVDEVTGDDNVPVCTGFHRNDSIFTVDSNSDEDDFLDAKSSLGMCASINTGSSTTVNLSDTRIEDDTNFKENNISVIPVHAPEDENDACNLSQLGPDGEKTADKDTDDVSVPFHTAKAIPEKDTPVSKIPSMKLADVKSVTNDYQTSPISSKQIDPTSMVVVDVSLSTISPNARGILKRRSIVADASPAASPSTKRVSFAEPIYVAGTVRDFKGENSNYQPSPRSLHRTRNIPKVNRRLSLQADRMRYPNEHKVAVSPLSLRSATVAEAIRNIRAKESNSSRLLANRSNNDDAIDFGKISIGDLQNPEFVRSLHRDQALKLFKILNSIELDLVTNVLGT